MSEVKYIAIFHQDGGCDYTIGCGVSVDTLKADSRDDAVEEVRAKFGIGREEREYDIEEISSVSLLEVTCEVEVDLDLIKDEIENAKTAAKAAALEAQEKAELERLYKKYGGRS